MVRKTPVKKAAAKKAAPPQGATARTPAKKQPSPPPKPNLAFVRQQLALAEAFIGKSIEVLADREDKPIMTWCEELQRMQEKLFFLNTAIGSAVREGKG